MHVTMGELIIYWLSQHDYKKKVIFQHSNKNHNNVLIVSNCRHCNDSRIYNNTDRK